MKIIVCIKEVPDTTEIKTDPETNTLIRAGVKSIISPFDMYAIEEGIRLKERLGGEVIVLSMGPAQAEKSLREAISLGADEAILLCDRKFGGADTLATSYTLAQGIKKIDGYDIIICGKQAADGDTAQVGPEVSVWLNIPQIAYVSKIEQVEQERIKVRRMSEEGYEVIQAKLPCLITVVKEINEPRLPSLKGKMRAKKAEIKKWTLEDINADREKTGLKGSPTQVKRIFSPPQREKGKIFEGDAEEIVKEMAEVLRSI
ncbi:MAG: electron transfer flavoprotein subunit beta/FixA family protein [Candidatus Omnitrophica bacterium]|nr:electron transfer flavoprotein subunit beta/FixA family protein [Candidatus Omnitrophota bacterium]